MSFRLQHASSEQHSASGNHPQTHRDAEAGHPLRHLHAAEQPAVRRPVQPGRCHLPGTSAETSCQRVLQGETRLRASVWLTLWLTQEAELSFLYHLAISPVMDYLEFPHFVSIRWHTSWRSWPRRCSPCPCWAAGWASTSGSRCSSWWPEWLSCRLDAVFDGCLCVCTPAWNEKITFSPILKSHRMPSVVLVYETIIPTTCHKRQSVVNLMFLLPLEPQVSQVSHLLYFCFLFLHVIKLKHIIIVPFKSAKWRHSVTLNLISMCHFHFFIVFELQFHFVVAQVKKNHL